MTFCFTDHYSGDVEQVQRQTLGTYVVNVQRALDFTVSRTFTERLSMSVGVPVSLRRRHFRQRAVLAAADEPVHERQHLGGARPEDADRQRRLGLVWEG